MHASKKARRGASPRAAAGLGREPRWREGGAVADDNAPVPATAPILAVAAAATATRGPTQARGLFWQYGHVPGSTSASTGTSMSTIMSSSSSTSSSTSSSMGSSMSMSSTTNPSMSMSSTINPSMSMSSTTNSSISLGSTTNPSPCTSPSTSWAGMYEDHGRLMMVVPTSNSYGTQQQNVFATPHIVNNNAIERAENGNVYVERNHAQSHWPPVVMLNWNQRPNETPTSAPSAFPVQSIVIPANGPRSTPLRPTSNVGNVAMVPSVKASCPASNDDRNLETELQVSALLQKKAPSSKYSGVSWHKRDRKWTARVWRDAQMRHLGAYSVEELAALAVDLKRISMHDEGSSDDKLQRRLNFKSAAERSSVIEAAIVTEARSDLPTLITSLRLADVNANTEKMLLDLDERLRGMSRAPSISNNTHD